MQYQALYRKYRPQRFDEVIGQDHITSTLAREVVEDKVAHAYLFTGPRGTGKTTSARLLSKSINCPNRADDGEPCNDCPSCDSITAGTSLDVIELDAASHNKVEDIREIRVNVSTVAAAPGAKRVYILDEAHMLSRAAGNALLKTLEEPPDHVVFVLATTEPYKLLDTIRSRSQRFDFHPVASETLVSYLAEISDKEGFTYDHAALGAVVSHAEGSVRDAMSLLEQVAALGAGTISIEDVGRALGLAGPDTHRRLIDAIVESDPAAALTLVSDVARQGADLRRFVSDAIAFLRGVFLVQYSSNVADVVDAPREVIEEWQQVALVIASSEVLRSIGELSDALAQMRDGREERLVLELATLRLTKPEVVDNLDAVTARLVRAEREIRELQKSPAAITAAPIAPPVASQAAAQPQADDGDNERPFAAPTPEPREVGTRAESIEPDDSSDAVPEPDAVDDAGPVADAAPDTPSPADFSLADFERIWPSVVASIRTDEGPKRYALLREATPADVADGMVTFEVAAHMHFHLAQLEADDALATAVCALAGQQLGQPVRIRFQSADAVSPEPEEVPDSVPDKDDLLEEGDDQSSDPAAVVLDILGGEIVSD